MNRIALLFIAAAIALGVFAIVVFALTGSGLNTFWLLGVFSAVAGLLVQVFFPRPQATRPVSSYFEQAQSLSNLDLHDGVGNAEAWANASHLFDQDQREAS